MVTWCSGDLFPISTILRRKRAIAIVASIYPFSPPPLLWAKKENHLLLFFKPNNFEKGARSTTPLQHTRHAACRILQCP